MRRGHLQYAREGKSMISGNLATLYALSSGRTLIIDADIHNSTLSRHYAPGATVGLLEVITGMADLDRAIVKGTGFVPDILPHRGEGIRAGLL